MKKVLMVAGRMDHGGLEVMLMNFFRFIDKSKVTFDFMLNYEQPGAFDDEIRRLGGRIYIMPRLYVKNFFKYFFAVNKFFIKHKGEYDIVHGNLTSVGFIYLSLAKLHGVKTTIIHAHSTDTKNNHYGMFERFTIFLSRFFADYYFACSDAAARFCFGKNVTNKSNYSLIKNGVNVSDFTFDKEKRKEKLVKLNIENRFVIGHVGRFEPEKNHDFILDVFNEVYKKDENAILMLVGEGSLKKQVEQRAVNMGLIDNIMFLGKRNDVNELMQVFDVFLLPSFFEGLPVVGVEAQASGLPCIFADKITTETDITGLCKFLSLENKEEWVNAILSVKGKARINTQKLLKEAGYDVESQTKWLEKFYLEH